MSRTEQELDLNVDVTFRHTESTPALKSYAIEKVTHCLARYLSAHAEVHVVLSVEKRDHIAEIHLRSKGHDAEVKAQTDDLYSAIDKMVGILDTQLRKQKERMVDGKRQETRPEFS